MAEIKAQASEREAFLPEGRTAGQYRFTLINVADGSVVEEKLSDTPEANFSGVPVGRYRLRAQRLDTSGAPLGGAASTPFIVEPEKFTEPAGVVLSISGAAIKQV